MNFRGIFQNIFTTEHLPMDASGISSNPSYKPGIRNILTYPITKIITTLL